MINLNVGSYTVMIYGWLNIDKIDLSNFAKQNGYKFKQIDIERDGLKEYKNETVDHIVASHFIEHLSREEGLSFLKECHRILKPEGILRISIPDARIISDAYINNKISDYREFNIGVEKAKDSAQSLWEMLFSGHKTLYDAQSLIEVLRGTGFQNVKQMNFLESHSPIIEKEVIDQYPEISTYIEAQPSKISSPTGPIIKYTFNKNAYGVTAETINKDINKPIKEKKIKNRTYIHSILWCTCSKLWRFRKSSV